VRPAWDFRLYVFVPCQKKHLYPEYFFSTIHLLRRSSSLNVLVYVIGRNRYTCDTISLAGSSAIIDSHAGRCDMEAPVKPR
jgi:hypothetical protein